MIYFVLAKEDLMDSKNKLVNNNESDLTFFENKKIRKVIFNNEWFYSIIDIIEILTESKDSTLYWRKLKQRLISEGNETVTNCHGLKMLAKDGKQFLDLYKVFLLQMPNPLNYGLRD